MASEATLMDVIGNKYIDTKTIEIIQHHLLLRHCPHSTQVYRAIALLFFFLALAVPGRRI